MALHFLSLEENIQQTCQANTLLLTHQSFSKVSLSNSSHFSPTESTVLSFDPAPTSGFLFENDEDSEDQIVFPTYDEVGYYEDLESRANLPSAGEPPNLDISRADSPRSAEVARDDLSMQTEPSRHVDYLSHTWSEEDVWSSWKHIFSKRGAYKNSARLENASWRAWSKSKYKLKTISPDTLNW
jgi:Fungal protein of unknown function (DUF1752)